MALEVALGGFKELIDKLNINVLEVIAKASSPALEAAQQQLTAYPPAPPKSHRTGNLGRSWAIQTSPTATVLRSSAEYAQFVVGPSKVANGWPNVEQVAQDIAAEATGAVEDTITGLLS